MIYSLLAGFLNGLGTIFLKESNNNSLFLVLSAIFYGMNFYFFRIALQHLKSTTAYTVLILSTLDFIKIIGILFYKNTMSILDVLGFILFTGAVLTLTK